MGARKLWAGPTLLLLLAGHSLAQKEKQVQLPISYITSRQKIEYCKQKLHSLYMTMSKSVNF
jgi:hypothetical protein